ncbi:putative PPPDE peptidase [Cryptosporidium felis]|nr:putative PPPDE peptidase [Cryptosporidium felis]
MNRKKINPNLRRLGEGSITGQNIDNFDQMENVSGSNSMHLLNFSSSEIDNSFRSISASKNESIDSDTGSNMVILNVYDLDAVSGSINKFIRVFELGAFHAGIEIYGVEYCFGSTSDGSSGITVNLPRRHPVHIYRESVNMGRTSFTRGDVKRIISEMKPFWPGSEYNIFRRNCLTFADELCRVLNVGKIPNYVKLLPELLCQAGDGLDKVTKHVITLFDRMASTCSDLNLMEKEQEEADKSPIKNSQENVDCRMKSMINN